MSLNRNSMNSISRSAEVDSPSRILITPFRSTLFEHQLAAKTTIDDKIVVVDDNTGIATGQIITIYSSSAFYFGKVIGISGVNITVDSPIDSIFNIGSNVDFGSDDLSVNGSVTPVIYSIRSQRSGIQASADITRIILQMTTTDLPDFGKFGDIAGGITNGLVLRRVDGSTQNIFNIKTNADLAAIAYDISVYEAAKPPAGLNGLAMRLTFGSSGKMGSIIRIRPDEDLQLIVQDDLSSILTLKIIAEGHVSRNYI